MSTPIKSIYFTEEELKCPCCGACDMRPDFIRNLNLLRASYAKAMKINSGFRCIAHNKAISGEVDSQHLFGNAVDVAMLDSANRYLLIELAMSIGFKGVGIDKNFVHIDMRTTQPVVWVYPI